MRGVLVYDESMNAKRIATIALLCILLGLLWVQMFFMGKETRQMTAHANEVSSKLTAIVSENEALRKDIAYYGIPENLDKFLRERFNYRKPSEKMIIVVPDGQRQ
jgi:hypothetical protein